jgi:crossover junction endodeoxyribonuclease RusA
VIDLYVHGHPAPQGSKRHVGRGIMVESSKRVTPWREAVVGEVLRLKLDGTAISEACCVEVCFYFNRPKHHYGRDGLKLTAPAVPNSRSVGDIDKLARSTLDGLVQASLLHDDCHVVDLTARKRYASLAYPMGARIRITHYGENTHDYS